MLIYGLEQALMVTHGYEVEFNQKKRNGPPGTDDRWTDEDGKKSLGILDG